LGLTSAKWIIGWKKFFRSALSAAFLLLAGSLFLVETFPSIGYINYSYPWLSSLDTYLAFPIIICALLSLTLLTLRMPEFDCKKSTLLTVSGAIMFLCAIAASLLGVISYLSYTSTLNAPYGSYQAPLYNTIINLYSIALALPAATLMLKKKFVPIAIGLTDMILISVLSLSFIFKFVGYSYVWLGAFESGISNELPVILLSATALVLTVYAGKQQKKNLKGFGALKGTAPFTAEDELKTQMEI
jgi:hypothetical protein